MPRDELDAQLRAWGHAQVSRHAANDERDGGPDSHPLSRARQFAPGTPARAERKLAGRDGEGRRRTMAEGAGVRGLTIVPQWAVDPIRCTETRQSGPGAAVDQGIPTELRWIDRAAMELYRQNTLRGLVLRMEYTGFGFQADRAQQVAKALGSPVTLRQYRDELRLAREWLRGRIAA